MGLLVCPPPTTPTPPPAGTCLDLPNGPFTIGFPVEIRSDEENRIQTIWADPNFPCGGSFPHKIRGDQAFFSNYKTKAIVYGCWEQSDDDGVTWDAWTDSGYGRFRFFYGNDSGFLFEETVNHPGGVARCEGRTFDIIPNFVQYPGWPAQAYQIELDDGPTIISGPAVMTQFTTDGENSGCAGGGSFTSVFGGTVGRLTMTGNNYHAFGIWHLDMQDLSFPAGHLMITVQVLGKSGGGGGNPGIKQSGTTSFYPSGPLPSLSVDTTAVELPAIGDTVVVTPSPSTNQTFQDGYFRLQIGDCTAYTADILITKIEWREAISGDVHDLWLPNLETRIHRLTLSKVELYNICPC